MTTPNVTPQETALLESVSGYSGYTESEAKIEDRAARHRLGGYGWFPKTDDEREQVRLMESITPNTDAQFATEVLWRADMDIQSLEDLDTVESWQIDGKPVFGSAKWFEEVPEVEF